MTDTKVEKKICSRCCEIKPVTDFYRASSRSADGYRAACKACSKEAAADPAKRAAARVRHEAYKRDNAEAFTKSQRNSWLTRNYGISVEDYDRMVEEQGGVCAICETDEPGGNRRFWPVDHDHETGAVRGLLCGKCNSGLGYFKDNGDLLMSALAYLLAHDGATGEDD